MNNKLLIGSIQALIILVILLLLGNMQHILIPISRMLGTILVPIIIATFLYYMIRPLVNLLEKYKVNRGLAVVIVLLTIIVVLLLVFSYGGVQIGKQIESLYITIMEQINKLQYSELFNKIADNIPIDDLKNTILSAIQNYGLQLGKISFDAIGKIGNIGAQIVLIPIILFYLLKDGEWIKDKFVEYVPNKNRVRITELIKDIDDVLSIYISGQISVAFVIGSLTFLAYAIIGLENAFVLGVINMIFSIIPFLGPILGIFPALIIASSMGSGMIIKVVIAQIVVQQLEGNFISPLIMGDKLKIHPLTVILVVMIAISQYGILGAFLAIPIYSMLRVILKALYKERKSKLENIVK